MDLETEMTVSEFESAVWELEGIRIVIRAGKNEKVDMYWNERRIAGTKTLDRFWNLRIVGKLNGKDFAVFDGYGLQPRGQTLVQTVRASYSR